MPTLPSSRYDPLLLHHWLWWKVTCYETSSEGFQQLFEKVIQRVDPQFMKIRPYGNIGDRKSDGLFFSESAHTVFQVYSPDELRQAEVQAKIEEDLAGAIKHWKAHGLKRWVFVYNTRRGMAPDIPGTLVTEQKKYPWLKIDHWSSDTLWNMVAALSVQKRSEILGAPLGYEHFFFASNDVDENTLARLRRGRFVLIHDIMTRVDLQAAAEALHPDIALGPPISIRPTVADGLWHEAAEVQRLIVEDAIAKSEALRPRFAVFSLSPIPLVVHLGFLLSDRVEVQTFQYDRDRKSWKWNEEFAANADTDVRISGLPTARIHGVCDIVVRVSLSARISTEDTRTVVPDAAAELDIDVAEPNVLWLKSDAQLVEVARATRRALQVIAEQAPDCTCIHLFYAGPTPGAIVVGQAINPRMTPEVALYEYSRQKTPRNNHVLTLGVNGVMGVSTDLVP